MEPTTLMPPLLQTILAQLPTDSTGVFPVCITPLNLVILLKSPHQYVCDMKHTILAIQDANDVQLATPYGRNGKGWYSGAGIQSVMGTGMGTGINMIASINIMIAGNTDNMDVAQEEYYDYLNPQRPLTAYMPRFYFNSKEKYDRFVQKQQSLKPLPSYECIRCEAWRVLTVNVNDSCHYVPILHIIKCSSTQKVKLSVEQLKALKCILYEQSIQDRMQQLRLTDLRLINSNQPQIPFSSRQKISISYFMRDAINVRQPKCASYLTIDRKGSVLQCNMKGNNDIKDHKEVKDVKDVNPVNLTCPSFDHSKSRPNFVLIGQIKGTAFFQIPLHANEIDHEKMERINYQNMQSLFNGRERKKEEQKIKIMQKLQQMSDSSDNSLHDINMDIINGHQLFSDQEESSHSVHYERTESESESEDEQPLRTLYLKMLQGKSKSII